MNLWTIFNYIIHPIDIEHSEEFFKFNQSKMLEYLETFPDDIWMHIIQFLPPSTLLTSSLVNRHFNSLCNLEIIWEPLNSRLLHNKCTVFITKRLEGVKRTKTRYYNAIRDSKRTSISTEELNSFAWWFTFGIQDLCPFFPYFKDGKYFNEARYGDQGLPYILSRSNQEITIHHMPTMYFKRKSDWGWLYKHNGITITSMCEVRPVCPTSVGDRVQFAKSQKEIGNAMFLKGDFWKAEQEYRKGMLYITHEEDSMWVKECRKLTSQLSCNVATCCMRLGTDAYYRLAYEAATFAFDLDPKSDKAQFRRILAMRELFTMFGDDELRAEAEILQSLGSKDEKIIQLCKQILEKPESPVISLM
jgi:tetratricopeptide (TPR) repeat protein